MKNITGRLFAVWMIFCFSTTILLVAIPTAIIYFLMRDEKNKTLYIMNCYRIWMKVFMFLVFCRIRVKGEENFEKGENYVVLCNHNSFFDILVSTPGVPGSNKTLAKSELARIPIFGFVYKAGSILVDRSSPESRALSIKEMENTLLKGLHLVLFPEGTRNRSSKPLGPFYSGAFKIAIECQKDIIPALIFNTRKILPPNKKFYAYPHSVPMHFLPPVSVQGLTLKDMKTLKEKVFNLMEAYYTENQDRF